MNKKVLLSLYITIIGLLTAGTALSVAWFSTNDFLQIDSVDINFETTDNLLISTELEGDYVSSLSENDLKKVDAFLPVSSMFSNKWMNTKEKFPVLYKEYDQFASTFGNQTGETPYVVPKEEKAVEGFYQQELFLKSEGNFYATVDCSTLASYLEADEETNAIKAESIAEKEPYRGTKEEIEAGLNSLKDAMRVSILVDYKDRYEYHIIDPNKNGETLLGGTIDSSCDGTYDVKRYNEDSKNYEIVYGEVSNRDKLVYSYNQEPSLIPNYNTLISGHAANTYIFDKESSFANGVEIAKEDSITFAEHGALEERLMKGDTEGIEGNMVLIPLDANKATRIVISIYLEGWDLDCINETMAASFDCKLTFKLLDRNII